LCVTVNTVAGVSSGALCIAEFSGVSGITDQNSVLLHQTVPALSTTPSVTTQFANEYGLGIFFNETGITTGTNGWTKIISQDNNAIFVFSQTLTNVGTYAATANSSISATFGYYGGILTFRPVSDAAATLTKNFYVYIQNTGTGTFLVRSSANIDGSSSPVSLSSGAGLLAVWNGTAWYTERGSGGSGGSGGYKTVEQAGVAVAQESILNFLAPITAVDNPGNTSTDITVPVFIASGASHATGLVPDPGSSAGTTRFLREDASFQVPPTFIASGASHASGYVPDPGASAGTTKFLREDATFVSPFAGRTTTTFASASITNGGVDSGVWTIGKSVYFMYMSVDFDARVRLYSTAAARDADVARGLVPPTSGTQSEVILDINLTSTGANPTGLTWILTPEANGSNGDSSPSTNIYYNVTNNSGATRAINVTFKYLILET
jgi:hypothetical protein